MIERQPTIHVPVTDLVRAELTRLEVEHSISVIFAVEAGSRAWGFESSDSDYDVRFVYKHPPNWYTSVREKRDVIEERSMSLDIDGWDVRKAFRLMMKGNPPLHEWIHSPTFYSVRRDYDSLKTAAQALWQPLSSVHHYTGMAWRNYRQYIRGVERPKRKKYLYVIRPILAAEFVLMNEMRPPVRFDELLAWAETRQSPILSAATADEIDNLLAEKMRGDELGESEHLPLVDQWLEGTFDRLRYCEKPKNRPFDEAWVDATFRKIVSVWP